MHFLSHIRRARSAVSARALVPNGWRLVAALALAATHGAVMAQASPPPTSSWLGGEGDWTAANWSRDGQQPPAFTDAPRIDRQAVIGALAPGQVTLNQSVRILGAEIARGSSLTLGASGQLINLAPARLEVDGSLGIGQASTVNKRWMLSNDLTLAGAGTTRLAGQGTVVYAQNNHYRLTIEAGHTLTGTGSLGSRGVGGLMVTNRGRIDVAERGGLAVSGDLDNQGSMLVRSRLELQGGTELRQTGGSSELLLLGQIDGRVFVSGGTVRGGGLVNGQLVLTGGRLELDRQDAASFLVQGDYFQYGSGTLVLGGRKQGNDLRIGTLHVTGEADLDETLIGFDVRDRDWLAGSYEVLRADGGIVGGFSGVLGLPSLWQGSFEQRGNSIWLHVSAVPEPATWLMTLAGLVGIGALSRRRRQTAA